MNFGIIGLGKMGAAIAQRAVAAGHTVWAFDPTHAGRLSGQHAGAQVTTNLYEVARHAQVIWLMVPSSIVDSLLKDLVTHVEHGSILIDGGNSNFHDSIRRSHELAAQGIDFLDVGTSGGVHGLAHGFSLMVGGDAQIYANVLPLLKAIAAPQGVAHVGPSGAGHYVKMVHNGIEYGLMQSYAEGLHLLRDGSFKGANLDLAAITGVWQHGSVIRSFLLDLTHEVLEHDQALADVAGSVDQTGMGQWTLEDAVAHQVPVPALQAALQVRADSHTTGGSYATKLLALMRHAFGGHKVGTKD
ncbi:decarboxylating 6-phosphogluconate dehydrogenase [Candidatus Dependentiae bacterium]|nr:decarboxylating 6-phosphogluconate dehydrogenase [Candidatus Dependentiae bacterium]MCC7414857.1 decarboxylating 6-phosphogluconate dehydrogenase [Campylobacterota bacterium]